MMHEASQKLHDSFEHYTDIKSRTEKNFRGLNIAIAVALDLSLIESEKDSVISTWSLSWQMVFLLFEIKRNLLLEINMVSAD